MELNLIVLFHTRPDNLDKRILVHYKYYPNMESVPEYVSQGQMNQAKSWARIKTANIMIATTIGLCLMTVIEQALQRAVTYHNIVKRVLQSASPYATYWLLQVHW